MPRIFLTGLSGAGKSTVGPLVAQRLGWRFLDTDAMVEQHVGCSISQIFSQQGEAFFRQHEAEALQSAACQTEVVVATGGGAILNEANRQLMRETGVVVYLATDPKVAWQRLRADTGQVAAVPIRPLLAGADGQQRLHALSMARQGWYEEAALTITTDGCTPEQLALQVIAGASAHGALLAPRLPSEQMTLGLPGATSRASIEWGSLHHLPQTLRALEMPTRLFVVTDSGVGPLYGGPLVGVLSAAGFQPHLLTLPAGEASKSLTFFQQVLDWLIAHKAERQEPLVALGGGVVGDLVGFVAACYQRGVPLIQVPTTLLAQVDAAIGGKTAINHPLGKNLIGAYYQPRLVLADPACLLTLPDRVYREGWGEIIKYGMALDAGLFELLEQFAALPLRTEKALLTQIIARCIRLKMEIVRQDEREQGQRAILNYGHTFGHALEAITGYSAWLHGEAVAVGMEVAAQIAGAQGMLTPDAARRQRALLRAYGLPIACPGVEADVLLEAMHRDKKVRDGRMRWVLPTAIGQAVVASDVPLAVVERAIQGVCRPL